MGSVTRIQSGAFRQEDILAAMQKASFQAERAGKIIRRVREFVKKSEPRRSAVQISDVLDDAIGFAEIDARRMSSRIVAEVSADLPPVFADRIMIEQVVLNLVKNGIDAMDDLEVDERVLIVRARRQTGNRPRCDAGRACSRGDRQCDTAPLPRRPRAPGC
jgi:C4-dicarboxylate-specific signal transduction histidine kinase